MDGSGRDECQKSEEQGRDESDPLVSGHRMVVEKAPRLQTWSPV